MVSVPISPGTAASVMSLMIKALPAIEKPGDVRETKAFAALWPQGHKAVAMLETRSLEETIEPDIWTIAHWQCVYIAVQNDQAEAYVISRYRSKEGKDQPVKLQGFPARKNPKEGWKLD